MVHIAKILMNVWVLKIINIISGSFVLHAFRNEVLNRQDAAFFYINWFLLVFVNVSECTLIQVRTEELRPRYDRNDPAVSFSRCTVLYFIYILMVASFMFWKQLIFDVAGEHIMTTWKNFTWDPDYIYLELVRGIALAIGMMFWLATTTVLALPDDDQPIIVLPFRAQAPPAAAA